MVFFFLVCQIHVKFNGKFKKKIVTYSVVRGAEMNEDGEGMEGGCMSWYWML